MEGGKGKKVASTFEATIVGRFMEAIYGHGEVNGRPGSVASKEN